MDAAAFRQNYQSIMKLVENKVASRIHAKDATLYDFSEEAQDCSERFMGWTDLASNPPIDPECIKEYAEKEIREGLQTIILVGMGGSSQAPMTISKCLKYDTQEITLKTLDSDSPVRLRAILSDINPYKTLFVISSKSGGTIEPRLILRAARAFLADRISEEDLEGRMIAITDPHSDLEKQALEEHWAAVFSGEPTVGGRFSALSVFGLVPAALLGVDIDVILDAARSAEETCSADTEDNPASRLAAFMYENYLQGRDKFSFVVPKRGRALGLWIEQLVAESLGKEGKGILPALEVNPALLTTDAKDRFVISYEMPYHHSDDLQNFKETLASLSSDIPRMGFSINSVEEVMAHFVLWEYAVAMCGYLMEVSPFDQPDVASAKAEVLTILGEGMPEPDYYAPLAPYEWVRDSEVRIGSVFEKTDTIKETLRTLFASLQPGDYFALNAFLPFCGEGRKEALEAIRYSVARKTGAFACLEIGPRYLHSTGQLQKGGYDKGVILVVSADEADDIALEEEADSLGMLAKAQAVGEYRVLSSRGRRVVHLHLPSNSQADLRLLASVVEEALE